MKRLFGVVALQCSLMTAWAASPATVPLMANGKPDLSGHWANPYVPDMARAGTVLDPATRKPQELSRAPLADAKAPAVGGGARTMDLPYTEWGLARWKAYDPVNDGDYAGSCLPFGMSRNINSPHGVQFVQNPAALAMLFEQNTWFHWVPTAGQKWPEDIPPSWNGVSTGHWEGDVLVVDTVGLNEKSWTTRDGLPTTDQAHLIERYSRPNYSNLIYEVTTDDPGAYDAPWTSGYVIGWNEGEELFEYICQENNISIDAMLGNGRFNNIAP